MTGKEFKDYINKNIDDDDIVDSIDISGHWTEADIDDLQIIKEKIQEKIYVKIII